MVELLRVQTPITLRERWKTLLAMYMFMQDTYWRNKLIRRSNKRRRKTSLTIFASHFICKVRKGYSRFACERVLETEQKLQYFDLHSYDRQPWVFLVSWCSTGGLGVHSAGCWLSLLHLISIFSGPQFIRAQRPLPPNVAFPTTSRLLRLQLYWNCPCRTQLPTARNSNGSRTQLSYIIVRRPLDLWNRMFNRHQAEITVMQFRGHSLPVHQSISVSWEFFRMSHFISQFPPTQFPLITAIRMCHLLPVHHLGMAFWAGSKGQNTTIVGYLI